MNPKLLPLLMVLLLATTLNAQYTELAPMPERVSNNAVVAAEVNGQSYVYSFCGIDSTKIWSGIHLKAWRLDVGANEWTALPDVPDSNGGKIAASANLLNGKIYVVGGYHVSQGGGEISSDKVHVFDPATNEWLPDAASIPVAIDDQVQAVWKDSLLYVITGWSNTTNVTDVQIYNPTTNEWLMGTDTPNQSDYKVFGGAGVIIGDTIYYAGGAKSTFNFPAASVFRKGLINPNNPMEIEWSKENLPEAKGYRMAAVVHDEKGIWLGGSDVTYNYNGIAYNNTGGVSPVDRITIFDPQNGNFFQSNGNMPAVMDLRGLGQTNENEVIIAGGMTSNQSVTNQVWRIGLNDLTAIEDDSDLGGFFKIYPNPTDNELTIEVKGAFEMELYDANSSLLFTKKGSDFMAVPLGNLAPGIYWVELISEKGLRASEPVMVN